MRAFTTRYHNSSSTTKGVLWMLLHCLALVWIMVVVRLLSESGMNNYNIIAWQNVFAFIMIAPYCLKGGIPRTKKLHLHIGRALSGISSGLILFYSMSLVSVNMATSITFTGPLFTTLFATIFFKEKIYAHRVLGLLMGFAGILVVLRPWTDSFNPHALLLVLTAALWGVTDMFIKLMNRTETIRTMMFYRILLMLLFTAPFLYFFHQPVSTYQLALMAGLAVLDIINFGTVAKAYRFADISVLMPFDFSRLIFSAVIAFALFGEMLGIWVAVGALIIVMSNVIVIYHEKKRNRLISTNTI